MMHEEGFMLASVKLLYGFVCIFLFTLLYPVSVYMDLDLSFFILEMFEKLSFSTH